jgi:glutaredoxin
LGLDQELPADAEIFSAGCPACQDVVELVERIACPSCAVTVLDMNEAPVSERAKRLGIRAVPAVVVDGELAECCRGAGATETALRAAGIGEARG